MTGQRGFVVPAVRQHPVALVGQALVPQLLERPDHRLHVAGVERLVVVVEVHPAGLAGDIGLPLVGVLEHRLPAGVVELLDAHFLDLRLVGDAELSLDLEFGGQAVGVPAEPALHLVAAHGAIPRHDVLDVPGQQVPVVRQPVGERRAVVEDVFFGVVAAGDAGAEGVVAVPVVQDIGFQLREVRRPTRRLGIGGHCVRRLLCPGSFRHGDDVAPVRERRGTTPLAHTGVRRSSSGCDGPARSVLLGCSAVLPKAPR